MVEEMAYVRSHEINSRARDTIRRAHEILLRCANMLF